MQGILILGGVLGFVVSGSVKSLSACCDLICDLHGPWMRNHTVVACSDDISLFHVMRYKSTGSM